MGGPDLLAVILVLLGAGIMAGSMVQGLRITKSVSRSVAGTWRLTLVLQAFFLVGYLLFASLVLAGVTFPLQAVTGVVFFGGACYVYLIIKLSKDTFYDLQGEIRERKATEENLCYSERRFRSIVEASPMGMHLYQLEDDGRLILTGANAAADAILGIDHGTLRGKPIEEAFPALTGTGIAERYRLIASTGEVWHADQVVYEGDAIRGVFEVHAFQMAPGRMVAMFADVTERRHAERSLRESEEMNRVLVEAFPDMVLRLDGKGTFLSFKAARDQEPFRPPGSFLGLTVEEVMPREIAERSMLHLRRALETGEVQIFEYRLSRDDGDRDFEIRVIASGEDEVIALAREITSRKRAESALEKAKDDLERQNRDLLKLDRMKEALISDVSHELKTPVAKQAMQVEILRKALREFNLAGKVEDIFRVMESGISRQQNVIRNILVMSRLESGGRKDKVEEFPLDGLVKEVLDDYRHTTDALGIETETDLKEVTVAADREILWHVFSNLVNNAVKYRREGRPHISVGMEIAGDRVRVRITDNGIGLTEKERSMAFERFYQASGSAEGIGLGLSISTNIVERFGGSLQLESEGRGRGATATVSLPLASR
jgi:PAS domain S-box-containing protein